MLHIIEEPQGVWCVRVCARVRVRVGCASDSLRAQSRNSELRLEFQLPHVIKEQHHPAFPML